jgi:hypothetical protein
MPVITEGGMVRLPEELSRKLRAHLRETDGEFVANAPLGMLMRYVAALTVGIPREEAAKYLHRINHKSF